MFNVASRVIVILLAMPVMDCSLTKKIGGKNYSRTLLLNRVQQPVTFGQDTNRVRKFRTMFEHIKGQSEVQTKTNWANRLRMGLGKCNHSNSETGL